MTSPQHRFTTDASEIDHERVHAWLSTESYWAQGRSREVHDRAVRGSRNFALLDTVSGRTAAYARVITDGATFAWLCDVFVDSGSRGQGLGTALVEGVMAELEPLGLRRTALTTADAHGVYAKFGFEPLAQPERWMARLASA